MTPIRKTAATVAVIAAVAAVAYLALFDPAETLAPQCLFHTLTGFDCPGCGSQRAVHALLHGDLSAAWSYNAALFFAVPVVIVYLISPKRLEGFLYSPKTLYSIAAAIALWWLLRNVCG